MRNKIFQGVPRASNYKIRVSSGKRDASAFHCSLCSGETFAICESREILRKCYFRCRNHGEELRRLNVRFIYLILYYEIYHIVTVMLRSTTIGQ